MHFRDEISVPFKDDDTTVLMQLLDHIGKKDEGSLTDYIIDFCDTYSYHIEDVAGLIKDNKNIRRLLKEDCINHKMLRIPKNTETIDEW